MNLRPPDQEHGWDYLVLTASNDAQAQAYETQLELRRRAGVLPQVRRALALADPGGLRIGSGGATVLALEKILDLEGVSGAAPEDILPQLRVLIVHAGGDSRRLPAYGPFGKIFAPLPGRGDEALPPSLFDRLAAVFLNLPGGLPGRGQIVAAAGDALLKWNPQELSFRAPGITILGSEADPLEASRHGVICMGSDGSAALYLQKPCVEEQQEAGAIGPSGTSVLDIGVMSMDGPAAAALIEIFGSWRGGATAAADFQAQLWAERGGLDLYREICCAMGVNATLEHYVRAARRSGSRWPEAELARVFPALHAIPFQACVLPHCRFFHFGTTRQLVDTGLDLLEAEEGCIPPGGLIRVNNVITGAGCVRGSRAWVEGCRIQAPLELDGDNVVTGVDLASPLKLPQGACLDVQAGRDRNGRRTWFIRCYGFEDDFKKAASAGGTFCGIPLFEWMRAAALRPEDVWEASLGDGECTLWNARVFPAATDAADCWRWLWMYDPVRASEQQRQQYIRAERYSAADIAQLSDLEAFWRRRVENWTHLKQGQPQTGGPS